MFFSRSAPSFSVKTGLVALIFAYILFKVTECLCHLGCDVDAISDTKHTPLQVMLMKDRMDCVYELFCYGADCNIGDSNGDTPLHWAVQVLQSYNSGVFSHLRAVCRSLGLSLFGQIGLSLT